MRTPTSHRLVANGRGSRSPVCVSYTVFSTDTGAVPPPSVLHTDPRQRVSDGLTRTGTETLGRPPTHGGRGWGY